MSLDPTTNPTKLQRNLPSTILALALVAVAAPARAEVTYALAVDPARSPGSPAADVRVILGDYDSPRPFGLTLGPPGIIIPPPPDTRVSVRVSHLRSTFAEVELSDLAGGLSSRAGTDLNVGLTGSHVFPAIPGDPNRLGIFATLTSGVPLDLVQVVVIGPGHEVESIFGRFSLASSAPAPAGVVLLGLGLAGVAAVRGLVGSRAAP